MEIFEILDRLEILNPTNTFFSDLRKVILNDDKFALFRLIQKTTDSQLIEGLRKYKDDETFNTDCVSRGQLESKLWLVKELKKTKADLGTVFLCAGWYGTLATMLFESGLNITKIRNFDIDPTCVDISKTFNKKWVIEDWKYQHIVDDIHNIDFTTHTYSVHRSNGSLCELTDSPDTIINTSCEHIENFKEWYDKIPDGKLVILQSNNYFEIKDHVNCSSSIEEFEEQTLMTSPLYTGELELEKYTRFMRIGYK